VIALAQAEPLAAQNDTAEGTLMHADLRASVPLAAERALFGRIARTAA